MLVCVCVCVCVRVCICMYVCLYMCMCGYVCECVGLRFKFCCRCKGSFNEDSLVSCVEGGEK